MYFEFNFILIIEVIAFLVFLIWVVIIDNFFFICYVVYDVVYCKKINRCEKYYLIILDYYGYLI